ncbi:MAG: hypothetical protein ABI627_32910 [Polyangiaceae bacterium]
MSEQPLARVVIFGRHDDPGMHVEASSVASATTGARRAWECVAVVVVGERPRRGAGASRQCGELTVAEWRSGSLASADTRKFQAIIGFRSRSILEILSKLAVPDAVRPRSSPVPQYQA